MNIEKIGGFGHFQNHFRLVMIGRTGNGKSSTVNSLIGQKLMKTGSSGSYITEKCEAAEFSLEDKNFLLVDTPGFGDLIKEEGKILNEFKSVMEFTYPGPHAFIIVLSLSRFNSEEKNCIDLLSKIFGKEIYRNSILIFTRIDDLEYDGITLNEYVNKCSILSFQELINACDRRYLGISNKWKADSDKMKNFKSEFFSMLNNMIKKNTPENEIYSSNQFEASLKYFEAEKKKIEQEKIDQLEKEKKLNEHFLKIISSIKGLHNEEPDLCSINLLFKNPII